LIASLRPDARRRHHTVVAGSRRSLLLIGKLRQ